MPHLHMGSLCPAAAGACLHIASIGASGCHEDLDV